MTCNAHVYAVCDGGRHKLDGAVRIDYGSCFLSDMLGAHKNEI